MGSLLNAKPEKLKGLGWTCSAPPTNIAIYGVRVGYSFKASSDHVGITIGGGSCGLSYNEDALNSFIAWLTDIRNFKYGVKGEK
jgi:hypothetical protein